MLQIQQEIVTDLREMANRGVTASQMLREVLHRYNLEEPHRLVLAIYCSEAFGLEAYQLGGVFYWSVDGIDGLSDAQVDHFLGRHIQEAAPRWKTFETAAPK